MKEHPLIYSADSVRATLAGRKDVTRRVITEADCWRNGLNRKHIEVSMAHACPQSNGANVRVPYRNHADRHIPWSDCGVWRVDPRWQPGDLLWIKESIQPLLADGVEWRDADWATGKGYSVNYVATGGIREWCNPDDETTRRCLPAMFMPKWACRIWREVVSVRAERLQDITDADAFREGIHFIGIRTIIMTLPTYHWVDIDPRDGYDMPRMAYSDLWNGLNAARGYPWDSNPLVWRIETKEAHHEA